MMTYKEIDKLILHYEKELRKGAQALTEVNKFLSSKTAGKKLVLLKNEKMKTEFFCFVTTSYIDLLCTYRNLKRSKSNWESFYNIKIAYLIAYETINTYHKYKGEIYKTVTKEAKEKYKDFFDMLNRELADFKREYDYDNIMPKIRNKSTAHYDKDFSSYYSSYNLLDNAKSKKIVRDFLYFINPLHYFTYGLMIGELDEFLFLNSWLS